MRLARSDQHGAAIPLTPLVDVMLILLVFFMVTSTYLDLDMIPATRAPESDGAGTESPSPASGAAQGLASVMTVRLGADGGAVWQGRTLDPAALEAAITGRAERVPGLRVVILPSGGAPVQSLVAALEAAARAGAAETRVLRLAGQP